MISHLKTYYNTKIDVINSTSKLKRKYVCNELSFFAYSFINLYVIYKDYEEKFPHPNADLLIFLNQNLLLMLLLCFLVLLTKKNLFFVYINIVLIDICL